MSASKEPTLTGSEPHVFRRTHTKFLPEISDYNEMS